MKSQNLFCFIFKSSFLFFLLGIAACQAPRVEKPNLTPVGQYGQIRVAGNRLVDKNGQPVQLRGMSLFWSQWMGQYYNPETVKWLKTDWGCTVVRAAMAVEMGGYLENPEAEKKKVMAVVDAAIREGLYVIIDWHDHHAQQHTPEAKAFFSEMARRYGQYPNVIYEIYNEPVEVGWSDVIKPYSETILAAIRQHDPDNIVVCGTPNWSQRVDEAAADPIADKNVAYTLHYYAATHKQELRAIAAKALSKGVALMVTEFGTCTADGNGVLDEAESRAWWQFMDDNQLSWCNWSVADKKETASALLPGAHPNGHWPDTQISPSGLLVRQELRAKNPARP